MKIVALITLILVLGSCHSVQKKEDTAPEAQKADDKEVVKENSSDLQALTKKGENENGQFSPDGKKIIFASHNRESHKSSQIYVLNLENKRERRVTYNDGDDLSPSYDFSGKHIIYSSTTDEFKEHPDSNAPSFSPDPVNLIENKAGYQEVYQSEPDGSHIARLTHAVGYDGEPSYSPDGRHIIFISQRTGDFEIFIMDAKGKGQRKWLSSTDFQGRPHYSPNGKLIAWETRSSGNGPVHIKVADLSGKHSMKITSVEAVNRDPSWTPDGKRIVFSSNREKSSIFSLYVMNGNGTCLKRLTQASDTTHPVADLYPAVSPDGKKLLFTSNRSGTNQLYLIDFNEPKECLAEKP